MSTVGNRAIIASAGTGKTEQLSLRYIRLLDLALQEGRTPADILALTFTRNAAWEMLERIAQKLARAVLDEEEARTLAERTDGQITRPRAAAVLDALIAHMPQLRISTIDSFMYRVVSCFALEAGLSAPPALLDEYEEHRWREQTFADVFAADRRAARTVQSLADVFGELTADTHERSVGETFERVVNNGYQTWRRARTEPAWVTFPSPLHLRDAQTLADAHAVLAALRKPNAPAWRKFLDDAAAGRWHAVLRSGLAAKAVEAEPSYYRYVFTGAEREALFELCAHAAAWAFKGSRGRTAAFYAFLSRFDATATALKATAQVMSFDDVCRTLAERLMHGGADTSVLRDVYYRLDGAIDHILIDEFQDTSWDQWHALAPLVDEVLQDPSARRTYFMVGDVKQAIYGFRGGDARLFNLVVQHYAPAITTSTLARSYRYGAHIAATVNAVFGDASAAAWRATSEFAPHESAAGHDDYVALWEAPAADESDPDSPGDDGAPCHAFVLDVLRQVAPLQRGLSTAVLCRSNNTVGAVMALLKSHRIPCYIQGRSSISTHPAVEAVLALLQWADTPGNSIAAYHVRHSYLRHSIPAKTEGFLAEIRQRLVYSSYAETLEWLLAPLEDGLPSSVRHYLSALRDLAVSYDALATTQPRDFVRFVAETPLSSPATAGVICATIHQSKGLGYDLVILPELDWRWELATERELVFHEHSAGRGSIPEIDRVLVRPQKNTELYEAQLREMYAQHDDQSYVEMLNILYVAMTRARHALYMCAAPQSAHSAANAPVAPAPARTPAQLLRRTLGDGEAPGADNRDAPAGSLLYARGSAAWFASHRTAQAPAVAEADLPPIKLADDMQRHRPSRRPSAHGVTDRSDRARLLAGAGGDALLRGTVIHALCARIVWLAGDEDARLDEYVNLGSRMIGASSETQARQWVAEFLAMLQQPAVHALLTAPGEPCDVECELPFAALVDGALVTGAIDRAVFYPSQAQPSRIAFYDFKTDAVNGGDGVERIVALYRSQMLLYHAALSQGFGLPRDRVQGHLVLLATGDVVACGRE